MPTPKNRLPNYSALVEPSLAFHPERRADNDIHPLRGLIKYGPYSRGVQLSAPDPIRFAAICPEGQLSKVNGLINQLQNEHQPGERREYLTKFDGFSRTFGVGLDCPNSASDGRVFTIAWRDLQAAVTASSPHERLAELLHSVIRKLDTIHALFDVALLYLPENLSVGFWSPDADPLSDFDLHDSVKALCSELRIPIQMLICDSRSRSASLNPSALRLHMVNRPRGPSAPISGTRTAERRDSAREASRRAGGISAPHGE